MSTHTPITPSWYYDDLRFHFSVFTRGILRVMPPVLYCIGTLFALLAWFDTGNIRLHYAGVLVGLFLLDSFFSHNKADRAISELPHNTGARVNIAPSVTPRCFRIVEQSMDRARVLHSPFSLTLCEELVRRFSYALELLELNASDLQVHLETLYQDISGESNEHILQEIQTLFLAGFESADKEHKQYLDESDLFVALLENQITPLARFFSAFDISGLDLRFALSAARYRGGWGRKFTMRTIILHRVRGSGMSSRRRMNRAWTSRTTPFLDTISQDISYLALRDEVGFLVGHEHEYRRIIKTLTRPAMNNVLLVGDPGAGKETLVHRLAYQIAHDSVPRPLFDKRVVEISVHTLLAGTKTEGDMMKEVVHMLDEIRAAGNVVLYIPDIHLVVKSSLRQITAADALLSSFRGGGFQVIATTYTEDYTRYIESQSSFRDTFEMVHVEEISEVEALRVLIYISRILQTQFHVTIGYKALRTAVRLAHRYLHDKMLPSSAEELLKEAAMLVCDRGGIFVKEGDVIDLVEAKTHIPLKKASGSEAELLLHLEQEMKKSIVGQDRAVIAIAKSLRAYRSGLLRSRGPIAAFLFVGPTGVGKTEVAKAITRLMFGDETHMIRLDMAEFAEQKSIARLLGSLENETKGFLGHVLREKPYGVVLLDEFEKAHPDVLHLFLSVFDEGVLTDVWGRSIDFSHTIIIATSNAHSQFIYDMVEQDTNLHVIEKELKHKLLSYFKPELLNRFSDIIVFEPLQKESLARIAELQLGKFIEEVRQGHGIELACSERAFAAIVAQGFDPVFGARPLRHLIEGTIKPLIAERILAKALSRRGYAIIDYSDATFFCVERETLL
ncbi:MAG: ATP-dependent Clp protease ATP-binding subunit [Patescibacteria group bacterium]|nr:ATP-dependent Clp protease ATP-binding subunit [Patescibacteria group bacterium]MDE2438242.1 ATP-dependent Clp protease ATP-binding subunit [Patescibacteria group bacterium]